MYRFFPIFNKPSSGNQAVILMYHRIANCEIDPWQLAVTPNEFERQLQIIKKKFNVISLPAFIQDLKDNHIKKHCVCITFDDGYRDNFDTALPLLEKHEMPATFFLPTQNIQEQKPFWWDVLAAIFMDTPKLDSVFTIDVSEREYIIDIGEEAMLTPRLRTEHTTWTWPNPTPTKRCEQYLRLWEKLKPLPHPEIEKVIINLMSRFSVTLQNFKNNMPIDEEDIVRFRGHSLVTFGNHTKTHLALSHHELSIQQNEMTESREIIEGLTKTRMQAIAYPYGDYNPDTLIVAKNVGFEAGFTTRESAITVKTDIMQLGRIMVTNLDPLSFEKKLLRHFSS